MDELVIIKGKIESIERHLKEFKEKNETHNTLLLEIRSAIAGNAFNDNKGLVYHQNKIKEELEKLDKIVQKNDEDMKRVSRFTWLLIAGFITILIYYFTKR